VREQGNERGRCGDRRGAIRPIYRAGVWSAGVGNLVTICGGD
jgi:hypothetical protein